MSTKTVTQLLEEAMREITAISSKNLDDIIKKDEPIVILDVREKEEINLGKIKNSLFIPRGMLEFLVEIKIPEKTSKVIIYCAKGPRSALAGKTLKTIGYSNVSYLEGGLNEWGKNGFEIG